MQQEDTHGPTPQKTREASGERARESKAEREGNGEPHEHPQQKHAIDEAHDRVGEQILGVAFLTGHFLSREDPADVGMKQA